MHGLVWLPSGRTPLVCVWMAGWTCAHWSLDMQPRCAALTSPRVQSDSARSGSQKQPSSTHTPTYILNNISIQACWRLSLGSARRPSLEPHWMQQRELHLRADGLCEGLASWDETFSLSWNHSISQWLLYAGQELWLRFSHHCHYHNHCLVERVAFSRSEPSLCYLHVAFAQGLVVWSKNFDLDSSFFNFKRLPPFYVCIFLNMEYDWQN